MNDAKAAIIQTLKNTSDSQLHKAMASVKKEQIGSGMRGDKIRTYRFQDNAVLDHNTDKKAKCNKVMKGWIDLLWHK